MSLTSVKQLETVDQNVKALAEAALEAGEGLLRLNPNGVPRYTCNKWPVYSKFFHNMGPIPHYMHQNAEQAALVGPDVNPDAPAIAGVTAQAT